MIKSDLFDFVILCILKWDFDINLFSNSEFNYHTYVNP